MNFAELKATRQEIWPDGEQENLIPIHDRYFVNALFDLQKNVTCLQSNNSDVYPHCSTYFKCGMTVLPAPRGHIISVSVIDKIDPYTGLESADAEDDHCSEIFYQQVDFCHLMAYERRCARCPGATNETLNTLLNDIFGPFRIKNRYPRPTDEGLETQPPLQEGFHYPQDSTDANGRSPSGVFAIHNGRIYIAPWIQSTETVVVRWNGIKRNWSDADLVDDDPKFVEAVMKLVQKQHELIFGSKEMAQALHVELWGTPQTTGTVGIIPDMIHECMEENRTRACVEALGNGRSGGGARGMVPTTGTGGSGALFYNEEVSYTASCPSGQSGDSVTVVKQAGTVTSVLSQADANARAMAAAQQEANSRLVCEDAEVQYFNTPQSYTATCPAASDGVPAAEGEPVTVTIEAGAYVSSISQEAADDAALEAAQSQANALLACTYWNEAQTYTASCPEGTVGSDVERTVAAGVHSSTLSQEDANAKAMAAARNEAEAALSCGSEAFVIGNTPQQFTAQVPCPGCRTPVITVTSYVVANTVTQTTTPARANEDQLYLNQLAQSIAQQRATLLAQQQCALCPQLPQQG